MYKQLDKQMNSFFIQDIPNARLWLFGIFSIYLTFLPILKFLVSSY